MTLAWSSTLRGSVIAVAGVAAVCAVKLLVDDFGRAAPFVLFSLAVLGAGLAGGARAGLLATLLATFGAWFFFLRPEDSFELSTRGALGLAAFLIEGTAVSAIIYAMQRARVAASASSERQRATIEGALDSIIVMDEEGRILEFNPAAQRAFKRRHADVIGKQLADVIIPPPLREAHRRGLLHLRETGEGPILGRRLLLSAMRADGSEFPIELSVTASRAGNARVYTGFVRDVSEHAWLTAQADEARERVVRLQSLTAALAAASTPQDVADVLVREGVRALDATMAILVWPRDAETLELGASHGLSSEVAELVKTLPLSATLPTMRAFRSARAEWVESSSDYNQRFPSFYPALDQLSGAAAALPLVVDGRSLAVVSFRFAEGRKFSADERATLETFAKQAAQALDRAQLHAAQLAPLRRLEALSELADALSQSTTRSEVGEVVVEHGRQIAGAESCQLHALDEAGGELELIAERGTRAAGALNEAGRVWRIPLIAEGKPIGLLAIGFADERRFPQEEREFVETFARQCAEALRRAQRLAAEQLARAVAERLRVSLETTLRSIGDAVVATDAAGKVTLMNPVAEALTGWQEAEARGRALSEVFEIVNEETREVVESPVERVLREGVIVGLANHTVLLSRQGRAIPIEDSGAPVRGRAGAIEGVVLVFRDVTAKRDDERRQAFLAEATVALGESLDYEATLAHIAELAVPTLADWCVVHVLEDGSRTPRQVAAAHVDPEKARFARELASSYPRGASTATGVPHVLSSGRSELYSEISDELLRASTSDDEQLRVLRELRLHSAMVVPLPARGRVLGAMTLVWAESGKTYQQEDLRFAEELARRCGAALDNARLYAAEQRASNAASVANRAKDEFLATVSHELRTPLNAIMGWAKIMNSASFDQTKRSRAAETIERNAVAMARLIEDLLDVSRIISGKMRLEVQELDLGSVVLSAIDSLKPAADAKGIRIVTLLDSNASHLVGDPARLLQIVWNVLSNAVKFTPKGGRVDVVLRAVESVLELCVSDTGKGIDPRFLPYVFEPFRQEEAGPARARGGLGLGLAITRQLVELHGGRIEVQSEGEGHGASFVIRLPRAAIASAAASSSAAREIQSGTLLEKPTVLRGFEVLVVDDEEDSRMLVKAILEQCGCNVRTAAGTEEALEVMSGRVPQLVISDIGMPERDGYDFIRSVRSLPPTGGRDVPAIALTAYARSEDRRSLLNAGYSMHVPKPVEPADLVAAAATLARFSPRPATARPERQ